VIGHVTTIPEFGFVCLLTGFFNYRTDPFPFPIRDF